MLFLKTEQGLEKVSFGICKDNYCFGSDESEVAVALRAHTISQLPMNMVKKRDKLEAAPKNRELLFTTSRSKLCIGENYQAVNIFSFLYIIHHSSNWRHSKTADERPDQECTHLIFLSSAPMCLIWRSVWKNSDIRRTERWKECLNLRTLPRLHLMMKFYAESALCLQMTNCLTLALIYTTHTNEQRERRIKKFKYLFRWKTGWRTNKHLGFQYVRVPEFFCYRSIAPLL